MTTDKPRKVNRLSCLFGKFDAGNEVFTSKSLLLSLASDGTKQPIIVTYSLARSLPPLTSMMRRELTPWSVFRDAVSAQAPLSRKYLEGDTMSCPRCESPISEGFYCIRCGYVPTGIEPIEQKTDTKASILDMRTPQGSCGIPTPPFSH